MPAPSRNPPGCKSPAPRDPRRVPASATRVKSTQAVMSCTPTLHQRIKMRAMFEMTGERSGGAIRMVVLRPRQAIVKQQHARRARGRRQGSRPTDPRADTAPRCSPAPGRRQRPVQFLHGRRQRRSGRPPRPGQRAGRVRRHAQFLEPRLVHRRTAGRAAHPAPHWPRSHRAAALAGSCCNQRTRERSAAGSAARCCALALGQIRADFQDVVMHRQRLQGRKFAQHRGRHAAGAGAQLQDAAAGDVAAESARTGAPRSARTASETSGAVVKSPAAPILVLPAL